MASSKLVKKTATGKTAVKKTVKAPAKKSIAKKGAKDAETGIKYSDKSAGQEHLIPIFNTLVKLMKPYAKGSIVQKGGTGGQVVFISEKPIEIEGRKKEEMYFSGVLIQKGYVGFYFMPVYAAAEIKKVFKPEILKTLKGKSCFHIKKLDDTLTEQIKEALKIGYDIYKKKGWID